MTVPTLADTQLAELTACALLRLKPVQTMCQAAVIGGVDPDADRLLVGIPQTVSPNSSPSEDRNNCSAFGRGFFRYGRGNCLAGFEGVSE